LQTIPYDTLSKEIAMNSSSTIHWGLNSVTSCVQNRTNLKWVNCFYRAVLLRQVVRLSVRQQDVLCVITWFGSMPRHQLQVH